MMPPKCCVCGRDAFLRYAPDDGDNRSEESRWLCAVHAPHAATERGWNGEWEQYDEDDFDIEEED